MFLKRRIDDFRYYVAPMYVFPSQQHFSSLAAIQDTEGPHTKHHRNKGSAYQPYSWILCTKKTAGFSLQTPQFSSVQFNCSILCTKKPAGFNLQTLHFSSVRFDCSIPCTKKTAGFSLQTLQFNSIVRFRAPRKLQDSVQKIF